MQIQYFAAILVVASALPLSNCLRCFTCSFTKDSADRHCIDSPNSVIGSKITNCAKKYCTILRQELLNSKGTVETFLRDCQDKPLYLNKVVDDSTYKTYYRSCTTDLCNSGDGTTSSGSSLDPDQGAGENREIPGRENGASKAGLRSLLLLAIILRLIGHYISH